jgi:hypothetical protein
MPTPPNETIELRAQQLDRTHQDSTHPSRSIELAKRLTEKTSIAVLGYEMSRLERNLKKLSISRQPSAA